MQYLRKSMGTEEQPKSAYESCPSTVPTFAVGAEILHVWIYVNEHKKQTDSILGLEKM